MNAHLETEGERRQAYSQTAHLGYSQTAHLGYSQTAHLGTWYSWVSASGTHLPVEVIPDVLKVG